MPEQQTCLGRGLSLFLVFPFKTPLLSILPAKVFAIRGGDKKSGTLFQCPCNPEMIGWPEHGPWLSKCGLSPRSLKSERRYVAEILAGI